MDPLDTEVAGLTCRQVLHHLNDFLDGELPVEQVTQVTAHLAGCSNCERFGGRVGALVSSLHGSALVQSPLAPSAAARLRARLATARG